MSNQNKQATSYTVLLGTFIARLRKERGFDQMTFAQKISASQPSLSKIENGQTVLNVIQLRKIARVLNVEPNYILAEVEGIANNIQSKGIEVKDHKPDQSVKFFLGAAAVAGIIALFMSEQ